MKPSQALEFKQETTEVVELLGEVETDHPALERLRGKLDSAAPVEAAITSYDRMHHRHSRS